jgi:hypothetical protein
MRSPPVGEIVRAALLAAGHELAASLRATYGGVAVRVTEDEAGVVVATSDPGLNARHRGLPGAPPQAVLGDVAQHGTYVLQSVAAALEDGLA